jgi:hypothetical protein
VSSKTWLAIRWTGSRDLAQVAIRSGAGGQH